MSLIDKYLFLQSKLANRFLLSWFFTSAQKTTRHSLENVCNNKSGKELTLTLIRGINHYHAKVIINHRLTHDPVIALKSIQIVRYLWSALYHSLRYCSKLRPCSLSGQFVQVFLQVMEKRGYCNDVVISYRFWR